MRSFAPRGAVAIAAALAVVYVVWGSTYLGIAVALETLPPLLMAGVRFLVAGVLLYTVASRFGDRVGDRPGGRQWLAALLTGGPLFLLGNGGVVWAQQTVPSGIAALLVATVPLWIALLDRVLFGSRLSWRAVAGLVLGFGGVALFVVPGGSGRVDPTGALILVGASLAWAVGSLLSRTAALPKRLLVTAAMQMIAGGTLLLLVGLVTGEVGSVRLETLSARSVLALAYLILFGSLVAFSSYAWLLRAARTSLAATYAYVNPVVAVALGWALLGEGITPRTLAGGAVILVAVVLIVSAPVRRPAQEAARSPSAASPEAARLHIVPSTSGRPAAKASP
ncbi:MAG: EamA family transporter, partial [Actinobacteria bacterium]|nr:EamA family transporter [Actinomycetota bacterium]